MALAAAIAIASAAFEPFYFTIFRLDRAGLGARLIELPYRKLTGLRPFLLGVRARTRPGDVIAVDAPGYAWDRGFEYYYGRSLYPLAGRQVVPLLDAQNRPHRQELARANYVAVYGEPEEIAGFALIWRGEHGALLRRAP